MEAQLLLRWMHNVAQLDQLFGTKVGQKLCHNYYLLLHLLYDKLC